MSWSFNGKSYREYIERGLKPEYLREELAEYRSMLGNEKFGIDELLRIYEIRSKAVIAEAICDAPEYLCDQIGKMRNSFGACPTITGQLESIADSLNRLAEAMECFETSEGET